MKRFCFLFIMMYVAFSSSFIFAKSTKDAIFDYSKPQFDASNVNVIDAMEGDIASVRSKLEIENQTDSFIPITIFVHDAKTQQW